jgi:hypothetical protein
MTTVTLSCTIGMALFLGHGDPECTRIKPNSAQIGVHGLKAPPSTNSLFLLPGYAEIIWFVTSPRPFNNTLSPAADIDIAPQPLPAFLKSLNINNTLKSVVSGAIGLVPEVGGILKSVVGILWPDDKPKTLQWDEIREGIKTMAQCLIDEERAKQLHIRFCSSC